MTLRPIQVLVVDDSKTAQIVLAHVLESDPQIRVIGAVNNGEAALEFVRAHAPDVVLMDIHMPRLDGFEATRRIMESCPVPIVVCSAITDPMAVATTFRVMEVGALACVEKPVGPEHPDFERLAAHVRQTVKLMSEVKVVRRWPRPPAAAVPPPTPPERRASDSPRRIRAVGIGASTGGPQVLQTILGSLPKGFPAPILVVQHIAPGFLPGLAEWLSQTTGMRTHIAAYGVTPLAGHVYFAPDDFHMGLGRSGGIRLTKEAGHNLRPAVSFLFRSLAETCGADAIGVQLTGMGTDGAAELKMMMDAGAITIAQDRDSSVVHGMPGEAIRLGGATYVLPAARIADQIVSVIRGRSAEAEE